MSRRSVKISRRNLVDIPAPTRCCALWEINHDLPERERFAAVVTSTGGGRILYVDGDLAAYGFYLPAEHTDTAKPTPCLDDDSADRPDGAVLMAARVLPPYAGGGVGKMLLQSVCKDAVHQHHATLDAVADAQGAEGTCVLPAATLAAIGFRTVQPHPRYPRLRLDLGGMMTWRDDLEDTVERWLRALDPHRGEEHPGAAGAGLGRVSR